MKGMAATALADRLMGERPGAVKSAVVAVGVGVAVAAGTYKLLRSAE